MNKWNFYIDRGGTFTDVVAEAPDGALITLKLLSDSAAYDDAALEGIRRTLGVATNARIPSEAIGEVRMGTTVATNALLERKGEPTVLVTTRGFADQLRIGNQNRPKLFALKIELPDMLYAQRDRGRRTRDGRRRNPSGSRRRETAPRSGKGARRGHCCLRDPVHARLPLSGA